MFCNGSEHFCLVLGRKRVAAGGAGGHGEAAGGRPQPTGRPRGGEDPLDLHGRGRHICTLYIYDNFQSRVRTCRPLAWLIILLDLLDFQSLSCLENL